MILLDLEKVIEIMLNEFLARVKSSNDSGCNKKN